MILIYYIFITYPTTSYISKFCCCAYNNNEVIIIDLRRAAADFLAHFLNLNLNLNEFYFL